MARRRSKLERYVDTLEALVKSGPTNLTRLTTRTKVDSNPLRDILTDLTEKELVLGRKLGRTIFFSATPKARTVLSHFKEISETLPIFQLSNQTVPIWLDGLLD